MDDEEAPLQPIHALALGIAAARGQRAWSADDMADAALLTVDFEAAGYVVVKGTTAPTTEAHVKALAPLLARVRRRRAPEPRDHADADRILAEVRMLGFGVMKKGA